jgi:hypothetical protein
VIFEKKSAIVLTFEKKSAIDVILDRLFEEAKEYNERGEAILPNLSGCSKIEQQANEILRDLVLHGFVTKADADITPIANIRRYILDVNQSKFAEIAGVSRSQGQQFLDNVQQKAVGAGAWAPRQSERKPHCCAALYLGNTFRENDDPRHSYLHELSLIQHSTRFRSALSGAWEGLMTPRRSDF